MPSRRQNNLFNELGLLADEELVNPYEVLGMSARFAGDLLQEDRSGEALKIVASGMHRLLSRRYHPDVRETGDAARFRGLNDANERIENASTASLSRWAKAERGSGSAATDRLLTQRETAAVRAAEIIRVNMEFGHHPQHFSQLPWTHGVIVERNRSLLLMRQLENGGMRVVRGVAADMVKDDMLSDTMRHAFDFRAFLKRNESFGIAPGTKIAAYVDELGRASILGADLSFRMDVSDPVMMYQAQRSRFSNEQMNQSNNGDNGQQVKSPVLYMMSVPEQKKPQKQATQPDSKVVVFPNRHGDSASSRDMTWDMDLEVAGSLSDVTFFRRIRHAKQSGAAAINAATRTPQDHAYFNLFAFQTRQLIENDAGYTPLLTPGNALLMYDQNLMMPVATDAKLIGLIGSNAGAA